MNSRLRDLRSGSSLIAIAAVAAGLCLAASPAGAVDFGDPDSDYYLHLGGWLRNTTGFNLEKEPATGYDEWYNPSMIRNELLLDADAKTGPLKWKFIGRLDREVKTDYLNELENLNNKQSPNGTAGGDAYMEQYDTTTFSQFMREAYTDFDMGSRVHMRLGRQQLVWGESDFFSAMDMIHGYDYRWRLFFENKEEYRKPLYMAHTTVAVPEANSNIDFFLRPGIDPGESIGNSYNIEGGRWIPNPYRGVDFTAFTEYNYHHRDADKDDPTYGIRWKGQAGELGYSLAYMRTFNPDPIMNPSTGAVPQAFGVTNAQSYKGEPVNGTLGDWIYPQINAFGVTGNYYVPAIDAVISAEGVFIPKKPYNYGALNSSLPGWGGVREKDTISSMIRIDKNLDFQDTLGTNRPSLSSLQIFDTWLTNFKESDEVVEFASFAHRKHEHTTYVTWFVLLNFLGDTINPSFVVGVDASNGGGFMIPAVDFAFGDDWRLKLEADLFWDTASKSPSATDSNGVHSNLLGVSEHETAMFGWFHGSDQFVARLTRQF